MKSRINLYLLKFKLWLTFKIKRVYLVYFKVNWDKLYGGGNQFHESLDMNVDAMMHMNKKEIKDYINDLIKRRSEAHENDLNN